MINPFVYGKEVSGKDFCNRKKEITELSSNLQNSQNVMIFSQRRFGKTSLIKEVFRKCEKEDIICIYVDLYPMLSEIDFVSIYARAVSERLYGKTQKAMMAISKVFNKLRPTFNVDPNNGEVSYGFDIDKNSIDMSIEDVMESVKTYGKKHKKKIAVCFDEFQQIGLLKTDKLEKQIRSYIQSHKDISYVFMGSKKHLIVDMFHNPNRPFYNSSAMYPLETIGESELAQFLKEKFTQTGKKIDDSLIQEIVRICEEHPYYVQQLAHVVWSHSIDEKKITNKHYEESLQLMLERASAAYDATWSLLTIQQRKAMIALSNKVENEKIFTTSFTQKYQLDSLSGFQRTLDSLINKDLIDRTNSEYSIIDVFFKRWILGLHENR